THFLGASAGVMAIATATTIVAPGYRFFPMINGGIPLWVLTVIFIVVDIMTISRGDTATYTAHAAGLITGFLFMFFLRRGYDGSAWMNRIADWVGDLFNPDRPKKGKDRKKELFYRSGKEPYTKTSHLSQQRIDEILDKINQHGYDHLTEEEKEILKRASKEEM
ncbi:MAG TPA: rhomboid family intramembrane serine protease, partial [Chitinophagaceae bacterium]|nr:rhomboid family intramembrane serine protease [Chitinophagaceae bacterium]